MTRRRAQSLLESFNFAFEGIIHVLRTQRNMRIHFLAAVIVLVTAVASGVSKLELIALLLAIAFVFIAEMINSALEQAIDVATTSFDPLAKLAKDIAAGAVLIATVNAVAATYASGTARQIRPGRRPSGNTSRRANRPTRSNGHSPVETVASAPSPGSDDS
jgi:diacylglycerol kinase